MPRDAFARNDIVEHTERFYPDGTPLRARLGWQSESANPGAWRVQKLGQNDGIPADSYEWWYHGEFVFKRAWEPPPAEPEFHIDV
jgi:hypothetical protein